MGFSVASLPGPALFLIVSETLRRGPVAGCLTMTGPLCVDALVMLPLAVLVQAALVPGGAWVVLGSTGAVLLFWLGLQAIRLDEDQSGENAKPGPRPPRGELPSFFKGVLTHLTNPYPYVYWGTVGVIFVRQGLEQSGPLGALFFPFGFWLGAGALNLLVILVVARGRRMLPPWWGTALHRFSGVLLMGCALWVVSTVWWSVF